MLRIGQLAAYAGVTTRTVRFYHQRGLLPEPERSSSGHRLYRAADVLRLSRATTLASAGVPLSRVRALLDAPDDELAVELEEVEADLDRQIAALHEHRTRLERLRAGDGSLLPEPLPRFIGHLRAAGVDEAKVDHYRDVWVLIHTLYDEPLERWLRNAGHVFESPDYRHLMVRAFGVMDADPEAREIEDLATDYVAWIMAERDTGDGSWLLRSSLADPVANDLLDSLWADHPASTRLGELIAAGLRDRGVAVPEGT